METKQAKQTNPETILAEFIRLDFDPLALADRLGLTPLDLLDFFERPGVAERLDRLTALIARGEQLRGSQSRAAALTALQRIVEDEQTDPLERRRAAATILRAVAKPRRHATLGGSHREDPPPHGAATASPARQQQEGPLTRQLSADPATATAGEAAGKDAGRHPRTISAPSERPRRNASQVRSTVTASRRATAQPAETHPAPRPP